MSISNSPLKQDLSIQLALFFKSIWGIELNPLAKVSYPEYMLPKLFVRS